MIEALIAAGAVVVAALIGLCQAVWVRRQNSVQHAMASAERTQQEETILLAITLVHDDVKAVQEDLHEHRSDPNAHKRPKPDLHVVSGV